MTLTVSVSDFRDDISRYLDLAMEGNMIVVKDEKKGIELVEVVKRRKHNPKAYQAMLKRVAGTLTAKNHPEWVTLTKVEKWLRKSRMNDERHFDVSA